MPEFHELGPPETMDPENDQGQEEVRVASEQLIQDRGRSCCYPPISTRVVYFSFIAAIMFSFSYGVGIRI